MYEQKVEEKERAESKSTADETLREKHPKEGEQIEQVTDKDQLSFDDIIRNNSKFKCDKCMKVLTPKRN